MPKSMPDAIASLETAVTDFIEAYGEVGPVLKANPGNAASQTDLEILDNAAANFRGTLDEVKAVAARHL